jgi:hypothetical protein
VHRTAIIAWMEQENGCPKILAIFDHLTASSGILNYDSYVEFEQRFGRAVTEAAILEYYQEQGEGG